jgi:hypothetical protein
MREKHYYITKTVWLIRSNEQDKVKVIPDGSAQAVACDSKGICIAR